ncbi:MULTISPECIES: TetR/AcrR family transcriptional regulator [Streptomyces]|uniref:TetR/AcrR family transcriptional regulator n=1 Tax=Streptomyces cyaneofuscatus TaxID=66883 RepID=A0ABZ1EQ64_9ACTN|nr:TetR/AcrR family transcriptional regulator [Streptomyces cyaneofuscatus]WSB06265.1 TetR/AcrR family transcriptional regulator [Streptomyces cyaneofuscatus]WSD50201.1 TetR/AcrR family transcriptional regulator [Streptomyces cyaneofuscatus]WTA93699.1 TetR/AcrR family transcriptional regulator [Streptomyces cyaneofuscatus]
MKKRPYHHGDLAAALLDRAEQTVHERGSEALSLRELARDLGVSPGAPSRHFKTKQALLDALALGGFERLVHAIETAREGADRTFAAQLDAVAHTYVGFATSNAALLDLMFSAKHSPEASPALGEAAQRWSGQFLELVDEGQRRGEVREGPPERVTLTVFAPLHGYISLTASGVLPPAAAGQGLDDVIASIVRHCKPEQSVQRTQPAEPTS